jgi:hypothetical protein
VLANAEQQKKEKEFFHDIVWFDFEWIKGQATVCKVLLFSVKQC